MLENGNLTTLSMHDILPNRFQPRIHFDEIKLNELAESIRKYGVIQPIVVRQIGNKYEIIAGERRYKASVLANRETIPAIITNLSDRDTEEIALLENIQRQNLTAIEEAVSYKRILSMGYITQEELAKKVGKSQSTIANKIRLLNLDDQVQDALLHGQISERHARSLLRLHNKNEQVQMLSKIINERLTVKRTDAAINELLEKQEGDTADDSGNSVKTIEPTVVEIKKEESTIVPKPIIKAESAETLDLNEKSKVSSRRAIPKGSHKISKIMPPKDYIEKIKKDTEGKDDSMDIDKILNEAQDINVAPETKAPEDISSLMQQNPNTVVSEPMHNEEMTQAEQQVMPPNATENNKFVNVGAISQNEEPVTNGMPDLTSATSFDNIFNQQPAIPSENVQNTSVPEPQMVPPIPSVPVMENPEPMTTPVIMENPEPMTTPIVVQSPEMAISNPQMSVDTGMATIPSAPLNVAMQEIPTIAPTVPTDFQNQQIQPQPVVMDQNSMMPVNTQQELTMQNGMAIPQQVGVMQQANQNIPSTNPSMAGVPTMGQGVPTMPQMPDNAIVMNNQQNMNAAVPADIPVISSPAVSGIPTMPSMQNEELPSSEIIESNASNEMPVTPIQNQGMAPSNDAHRLMQAINMIRNCAKDIENLGFYIDVDEVNLDNTYKVTFTINKE